MAQTTPWIFSRRSCSPAGDLMKKFLLLPCIVSAALAQTVIVHPKLIHDVLVNPDMGIQTFQRFNGDPLNSGLKWSEEGPTAPIAQSGSVDFPATTLSYCRWFWETL